MAHGWQGNSPKDKGKRISDKVYRNRERMMAKG
jgi:uncharacterized C2H2 Zn-finger protein